MRMLRVTRFGVILTGLVLTVGAMVAGPAVSAGAASPVFDSVVLADEGEPRDKPWD